MKSIKNVFGIISLSFGIILFGQTTSSPGATATVLVGSGGLRFVPATTNILVNDSVTWSWAGSFHSTTSGTPPGTPNGLWDSGVNNAPHSFSLTFANAGTFPYYCSIHFGSGMVGSIIVSSPAVPPDVTITNPASGTVLSAPASLNLAASASVASGSITSVQFFQGTTSLGSLASPPFSVPVNNLSAAAYTFSAVATANSGLTATNSISVNVIDASPLVLAAPMVSPPGHFGFSYSSDPGLTYVVQVSANLASDWTSIDTNTATANPTVFVDPNTSSASSFYRVLRLPNP
ncbi:MAG TPA: Ig-like domain-containing protein [Candidatus Acidoferrum sp.]|jgi:plastocyanin|nr:Ig-like domain-containing protein [Candidatus Acidoferrum sp.]